ncbi:MAG: hypothetical protein MUE36_09625 [Acidimicrobiales bacterium]|nr:hypothetical protein [Acidimicrobiales bacterium]
MRDVLVALFWAWLAVSLLVYGYRLYRRITQGSKATREARAAATEGRTVGLGEARPTDAVPPLAPGLPRSLAGKVPEGDPAEPRPAGADGAPGVGPTGRAEHTGSIDAPEPPPPSGAAPIGAGGLSPTVVQALWGIDLPCDLVPIADGNDGDVTSSHRVVFTTRTATVRTVAASLADELERLGYRVSNAATDPAGTRHRLIATRTNAAVSVSVTIDAAGAVAAEVTT